MLRLSWVSGRSMFLFSETLFQNISRCNKNLEVRQNCVVIANCNISFKWFEAVYLKSFSSHAVPNTSNLLKTEIMENNNLVSRNTVDLDRDENNTIESSGACHKRKPEDMENKKVKKAKKFVRPGFGEDRFNESEYYFENGLRKVYPYYFPFTTFCKGRWVGQRLLDVLLNEFAAYTKEQYEQFIKLGTLTVNQKSVTQDYIFKDNDFITNVIHRHETPVLAAPLKIIHKSDELLVLDKPPSIPVHPCGGYRHNSVTFILGKEHNIQKIYPVHRLDRLTSGLLMFGLNSTIAKNLTDQIKERKVQKEYLCRVEGNFPDEPITCNEPLDVLAPKIGICAVDHNGKECTTVFKKLSYNGKSSVVLCKPLTGRTHQIRVHLQYLGHPIVNDPLYNSEIFGPTKGKGGVFGKSKEELVKLITETHTAEKWWFEDSNHDRNGVLPPAELKMVNLVDVNAGAFIESSTTEVEESTANKSSISRPLETCPLSSQLAHYTDSDEFLKLAEKYQYNVKKVKKDPSCTFCKLNCRDPKAQELIMFLHAYCYSGEGFSFQSDIPKWAKEDWTEN